jgi:hypothetical protein
MLACRTSVDASLLGQKGGLSWLVYPSSSDSDKELTIVGFIVQFLVVSDNFANMTNIAIFPAFVSHTAYRLEFSEGYNTGEFEDVGVSLDFCIYLLQHTYVGANPQG